MRGFPTVCKAGDAGVDLWAGKIYVVNTTLFTFHDFSDAYHGTWYHGTWYLVPGMFEQCASVVDILYTTRNLCPLIENTILISLIYGTILKLFTTSTYWEEPINVTSVKKHLLRQAI